MKRFPVYFSAIAALVCVAAPGASALPADRAYELVSSPESSVSDVIRVHRAQTNGEGVLFGAVGGDSSSTAVHLSSRTVARRTADGWAQFPLLPPGPGRLSPDGPVNTIPADFSEDLSDLIVYGPTRLVERDQDPFEDVYRLDDGQFVTLLSQYEPEPPPDEGHLQWAGGSRDLQRVVLYGDGPLIPGGPARGVYESVNGELRLVSIHPDDTPMSTANIASSPQQWGFDGGPTTGPASIARGGRSVSDDGSRIFFLNDQVGLSVRENGLTTRNISVSRRADTFGTVMRAYFVGATPDGSEVVFSTNSPLTEDSAPGGGLYRYNLETDDLDVLTPPVPNGATFNMDWGIASEDLSRVYFITRRFLAPDAAGSRVLYVWENGETKVVAPNVGLTARIRRVSRGDGRFLAFESSSSLGGAPNGGMQAVYRYDAASGVLTCVSCRPDGTESTAKASIGDDFDVGAQANEDSQSDRSRSITDDGEIVFVTADQIVPEDVNGVQDVYLYDGTTPSLISTGRGDYPSYIGDNSDDGDDIFFLTREKLARGDADGGAIDLYDARVGGGFAEPAPVVPCQGEACRPAASPSPALADPVSESFKGLGDLLGGARPAFSVRPLSAARRARLALGRRAAVRVKVNRAGRVSLVAFARIDGRRLVVARGAGVARRAGGLDVAFRLYEPARRKLAAGLPLPIVVSVSFQSAFEARRLALTLRRDRGSSRTRAATVPANFDGR